MKLEDLRVYTLSLELAETVWNIIIQWDYFQKDTIGKQLVRSCDSISANISEGFGRYHFKETIDFGYYARGSLFETKTWLVKAHNRNLIADVTFSELIESIDILGKMLNKYIKSIGKTNDQLTNI